MIFLGGVTNGKLLVVKLLTLKSGAQTGNHDQMNGLYRYETGRRLDGIKEFSGKRRRIGKEMGGFEQIKL